MAKVSLMVGGRPYDVQCSDGDEAHLAALAEMIDAKATLARQATPGLTEARTLLFAAILMADEIHDLHREREKERAQQAAQASLALPPVDMNDEAAISRLNGLAKRIEALATKLAGSAGAS